MGKETKSAYSQVTSHGKIRSIRVVRGSFFKEIDSSLLGVEDEDRLTEGRNVNNIAYGRGSKSYKMALIQPTILFPPLLVSIPFL